ncbi:MAG: arylsulfotransferase family protein [Candidatus Eisenbacteria bacterium]
MRPPLLLLCLFAALTGCESGNRDASETASTATGHGAEGTLQGGGAPGGLSEAQERELERIGTLGYTVGGDRAPDALGVTVVGPEASEGYTVYVSGDFPGAHLIDIEGRVLHTWREDVAESWSRAWVYPDGSVLGVSAHPGRLIKLDRDSRLLWTYGGEKLRAHHDVTVDADGTIYVLMRVGTVLEWLRPKPLLVDLICILEPDGESVREVACVPVAESFRDSRFAHMLESPVLGEGEDPFHTNCVEVLDGRVPHPAFRDGNILVTIRNMDCLAVIDPDEGTVVWANVGRWQRQHEARVTPDGRVMLFDNRKFDGKSRVIEYDVVADEIVWSYAAENFFSQGTGAQQLLPNDNVLVTESQKGRVFEVTREGRVVWEFWNPSLMEDGETIVRVTRAFRVPYDYFEREFGRTLRQEGGRD